MRIYVLKAAAGLLFAGTFVTVVTALDTGGNVNPRPTDPSDEKRTTAPEIHPVAAGAAGILVVGGIALLTARRRPQAPKP